MPAILYANPRRNYVPGSPDDVAVVPKSDYDALVEFAEEMISWTAPTAKAKNREILKNLTGREAVIR